MTANKDQPLILMTGSSGLIGSRLQRNLKGDYRVVGLDVAEPKNPIRGVDWLKCDLTEDESVRQTLEEVWKRHGDRIASVVHLAAYYDFSGEPSDLYEKLTVQGTRRLIRALQDFQVEQFIFSSTLLVMEPVEEGDSLLTERSPKQAEWDYPRSKLATERVLREERGEIPVVILRLAGVYDEEGHSLPITQQIRRIYERQLESYLYPGDASHGQSFLHLDDLVGCVRRVIELRTELDPWEIFLIGEPEVMSYASLQDELGRLIHDREWMTLRIPKPVAKAGAWAQEKLPGKDPFIKPWMIDLADQHYPVNIQRARKRLNWKPRHHLKSALKPMVDDLKKDPVAWYEKNGLPLPEDLQAEASSRR